MLSVEIANNIKSIIPSDTQLLVSFSGGPDSVYLLYCLLKCIDKDLITLCYFNHQLQENQELEFKTVKNISKKFQLKLISKKIPIHTHAKRYKLSIEESGHICRKRMIEHLCKCLKINYVFTGHHQNDHLETRLFSLIKGTATNFGRLEKKTITAKKIFLCKPLLNTSKNQILSELKCLNIEYHEDKSNKLTKFNRNLLRSSIIPDIKKINKNILKTLQQLDQHVNAYTNYIDQNHENLFKEIIFKKNHVSFCKNKFLIQDSLIQYRILFNMYRRLAQFEHKIVKGLKVAMPHIGKKHLNALIKFITSSKGGGIMHLPLNLNASIERNNILLWIERKTPNKKYRITTNKGSIRLNHEQLNVSWELKKNIYHVNKNKSNVHSIKFDNTMLKNLCIKPIERDDTFQAFNHKSKIKAWTYLKKKQYSKRERENMHVLAYKGEVICILGVEIANNFKVLNTDQNILELRIE